MSNIQHTLQDIADATSALQDLVSKADNIAADSIGDTVDFDGVLDTLTEAHSTLMGEIAREG